MADPIQITLGTPPAPIEITLEWVSGSPGSGVSNGTYGDISVSGSTWTIGTGAVTKTKLSSAVQASLDKADSALQSIADQSVTLAKTSTGVQASLARADGALQPWTAAPARDAVRFPPRILRDDVILATQTTAGAYAQPSGVEWRGALYAFAMKDSDSHFADAELKFCKSTDDGYTWSSEATVPFPAASAMTLTGGSPRWICVQPSVIGGVLYLLVQANVGGEASTARNETYLFRTADLSTFVQVARIVNAAASGVSGDAGEVSSSPILVLEDGTWIFGHYSNTAGTWNSCAMRSTDRGVTWTKVQILSSAFETVILRHGAGLVALIRTATEGELKQSLSTDSGLTWSTPAALAVPTTLNGSASTYSSNGAWFYLTEKGEAFGVIRMDGPSVRKEALGLFRNVVSGTSSAEAYELPTIGRSFGGWVIPRGDGRYGLLRCSYTGGGSGPNRLIYNEIALSAAPAPQGLIVPDVIGMDTAGNSSGLLRGLAAFSDLRAAWDAGAVRMGSEWGRGLTVTTTGGSLVATGVAGGYRDAWAESAITNSSVIGSAGDFTFLHDGTTSYFIAMRVLVPDISGDVDLLCTNNSTTGSRGIRLQAIHASNSLRLTITKGDSVNSHVHTVAVLQRGTWAEFVWHVSPSVTTLIYGANENRSTSTQAVSLVHSTGTEASGLIIGNYSASGNTGVSGLRIADVLVLPGALSTATLMQLFAYLRRGGASGGGALPSSGSGDVTGPASSTDNELPRFDGTTGKTLQGGSGVIVTNAGDMTVNGELNATGDMISGNALGVNVKLASDGSIVFSDGTNTLTLQRDTLTAGQSLVLPDESGTLATTASVWKRVARTTDSTAKVSDTTLAADSVLKIPMAANQKICFRGSIFFSTPAAADLKWGHTSPAGYTAYFVTREGVAGGGTALTGIQVDVAPNTAGISMLGSGTAGHIWLEGTVTNGATAGDWVFMWAQVTSTAGNTYIAAGSYLEYWIC